jgi:putative tricarboxylic transport membrane protein
MLFGVKAFVQALRLPHHLLAVAIMVLCVVGSYSLRNSMFDVGAMVVVGLFGYLLQKARVPLTPILLGLVLGPTMERELRTAMIMSGDDTGILLSPIALVFFGLALLVVLAQAVSMVRAQRQKPTVSA